VHDRDGKFPERFREFWRSEGVQRVRTPVRTPKANAYAESFIGTLKRECLNHFICFSRDQMNYIVQTWVKYYNTERPHRGKDIGNNLLDKAYTPKCSGSIRCKKQLGGIITSYYRDAA
jgi:putative transposase